MGDRDRALEARGRLRDIDVDQLEGDDVRKSHREAVRAVERLIEQLSGDTDREEHNEQPRSKPDSWEDEETWEEALESAHEKAGIGRSKGTITTKTIDEREYYYLQWRDGDAVKSQYIGPVNPA
ncbi:hypothetical protein EGH21_14745 [Halomicroarcula sp. F13]|uniref:DUF6788 domain-containing protein n=1 Tax=Haloarcula rubra TaxID=2487747 RepID=A0AAW4PUJ3_9EURY|nr:hypothetical protein [Halomicroarcula rubra]MBX0324286.1 hypothetical protein [Halomicroarcula rubra]